MISLDMRTLVFGALVTDIVCLVVIILLWQQSRNRFPGTIFWVCDFILTNATFALIALRGTIPDWASIVLANAFAMIGMFLGYIALLKFTEKRGTQIHNYLLLVAVVSVHAYFTYDQPNLPARNINIAAGILIICFQCAWLMLYGVPVDMRPVTRLVGLVFCGYCLASILRLVASFTGTHANADYLQSGTLEKMILVSYQVLFIVLTYSLVLMFNRRLHMDVAAEQEKFLHAFESSPYGITITRASDGRVIEVNKGFVDITGYTVEEVKGRTTTDLRLWAREEDRALVVNELLQNPALFNRELFFRKKSGEIITGLFSAERMTINNEICILSSISDITERRRAEEELRRSQERLTTVMDNVNALIYVADMRTYELLYINEYGRRIWGDVTGQCCWKSIQKGEDGPCAFCTNDRLVTPDGEPAVAYQWEFRNTVNQRWYDCRDAAIRWADGRLVRMEIATDITDRKRAEETLREKSEEQALLLRSMFNAFVLFDSVFDVNGKFVSYRFRYINEAYERITGVKQEDVFGKTVHEVWPETEASWIENYGLVAMTGKTLTFDMYHKPTAKQYHCYVYRPWETNQQFCVVFDDITERKRAEEEIQKLNAELEQRIADRTRDLADSQLALLNVVDDLNLHSKQLDAANEKMAAANKELEAFSYSVSHDLRAPLRHLNGFVELLREKLPPSTMDEETGRYLTVISNAAAQMSRLVDDLLKFSRMGRAGLTKARVRCDKLVGEAIDTLQPATRGREIAWKIDPLPEVTGDATMLRLVMVNLIANAVKFTGTKPKAEIEIRCDQGKEDEYVFSVRDNGAGFDMKYANKLFNLFQRLHRADEFEGTGAGLANVRRIVQRHGGRTWAEGAVGEGAVFYFSLPKT